MLVSIIGMGAVGSAIANNIVVLKGYGLLPHIKELKLHDTDIPRLRSELHDLRRVQAMGKDKSLILDKTHSLWRRAGVHIIAVGERRKSMTYSERTLFNLNLEKVKRIVEKIEKGRIIMVTNPAKMFALHFKTEHAGDRCDKYCDAKFILSGKGYTNWGIAKEVVDAL
jgi:malate/lactate dehydrogenase